MAYKNKYEITNIVDPCLTITDNQFSMLVCWQSYGTEYIESEFDVSNQRMNEHSQ